MILLSKNAINRQNNNRWLLNHPTCKSSGYNNENISKSYAEFTFTNLISIKLNKGCWWNFPLPCCFLYSIWIISIKYPDNLGTDTTLPFGSSSFPVEWKVILYCKYMIAAWKYKNDWDSKAFLILFPAKFQPFKSTKVINLILTTLCILIVILIDLIYHWQHWKDSPFSSFSRSPDNSLVSPGFA